MSYYFKLYIIKKFAICTQSWQYKASLYFMNVPHVSNYGQHFFTLEIAISGVSKDIFHHISKLASFGVVCEV